MAILPVGVSLSAKYTLTGPDGTIATFNDQTDANFVGFITDVSGLDSPEVRDNGENLAGQDGGVHGPFYYGRRPITMSGALINLVSPEDRNKKLTKLAQASNAMRTNAILTWTPDGGEAVFVEVRRQQPLRVTGNWEKSFQLLVVAADPAIYSVAQETKSVNAAAPVTYATGTKPGWVIASPDAKNVYVLNETSNTISIFTRETNGTLVSKGTKATGTTPTRALITSDGKFIYVSNKGGNTVTVFSRAENGELALVESKATGEQPIGMGIGRNSAATRENLFVANLKGNSVSVFERNKSTGALTLSETKAMTAGDGPTEVAWNSFYGVVVLCQTIKKLRTFAANTLTGLFGAEESTTTFSNTPETMLIRPGTVTYEGGVNAVEVYIGFKKNMEQYVLTFPGSTKVTLITKFTLPENIKQFAFDGTFLYGASTFFTYIFEPSTTSEIYATALPSSSEASGIVIAGGSVYISGTVNKLFFFTKAATGYISPYSGVTASCINNGSMETFPTLTIVTLSEPAFSITITNQATKQTISFPAEIPAFSTVTFNFKNKTITDSFGHSLFAGLELASTEWWALQPGTNEIIFSCSGLETKFTLTWHHAWI